MINDIVKEARKRMDAALKALQKELGAVRTGRASLSMLDNVKVNFYGTDTALNQAASLALPEGNLIVIQPWDAQLLSEIEKAILKANLDLTPQNDGKVIRIHVPPLTEERRQKIARSIKEMGENGRTALRHVRRDVNDLVKIAQKDKKISEDDEHIALKKVQELTDEHIKLIDDAVKRKEKEVMEI